MPSDPNLKAARAVVLSRQRLQKGLSRDASNGLKKPFTLRDAECQYPGSKKSSIARIVKRLEEANTLDFEQVPEPNKGRPRLLSDDEEEAIVSFIIWMQKSGLPASKHEIEDAASTIRSRRDPDAVPVGRMWYRRFCDDHPELDISILKAKEATRFEYEEAGVEETKQWFKRLTEVITRYGIGASECWNADQAGIRVGILRERVQCLVVRTKKKTATEVFSPEDRETCTVIGTGNAAGATTPPWLIFKAFPTIEWSDIDGDPNMRFAQSETAFSNAEITLEWAKHFNRWSWEKSATVQHRQLDFEQWFGCNEHLKSEFNPITPYDTPPGTEGKEEEELEIFDEGFTAAHIIAGFEKSGIFPPTDKPAVNYLLRKKLKTRKAIDPALSSLLPEENRFPLASDTARDIGNRYHDILSSPTLRGLESVRKIVNEAIVLEEIVRNHVEDRRARIEKRYHQRKRGKRARPMEEIKAEWRANKEVIVNGVTKKMQFKQWLEYTGKDVEYASYDSSRAEMTSQLKEKEDFFMIDTQLAPETHEAIHKAGFAAKPLSAVDLSHLLCSDDTVDFTLTQPPADADEESDIDLSDEEDLAMPSSPPCLPDYESSVPTMPSTPCPLQYQARFDDAFINRMIEETEALEAI
ncbi:uncharacterized protein FRV6_16556 [Fusarium oxysporum]|uniref:HTH CENPB-type domain-containing protein n=1 Tax=Fusarium oxysporum TaxID=5507 RepID=A0A2H3TUZ0_FUSOX|nr:uncharacterized protein FRV6_16556 [Fusarium oxysporum]